MLSSQPAYYTTQLLAKRRAGRAVWLEFGKKWRGFTFSAQIMSARAAELGSNEKLSQLSGAWWDSIDVRKRSLARRFLRGLSRLSDSYGVQRLPMAQLFRGLSLQWPSAAFQELVSNV